MRLEKQAIIDEIKSDMESSAYTLMVGYQGLSVQEITDLRAQLRDAGASMLVAKNRFTALAAKELGLPNMDGILKGPTAIIFGEGEVTTVSKLLKKYAKDKDAFTVNGGVMDQGCLSAGDVDALASIPSREVLLSQVVGTVAAPMSGLVGVMQQKLCTLVYVLKAVEEKKNNA